VLWFALTAVLAVLAIVLDGTAGGIAALGAMVGFVLSCAVALRTRAADDRAGIQGFVGHWF
jgi:hypothetical protein